MAAGFRRRRATSIAVIVEPLKEEEEVEGCPLQGRGVSGAGRGAGGAEGGGI